MPLKYICNNCGKTFSPEEFARLAMVGVKSGAISKSNSDIRKCDYCGKQINVWRF